MFAVAAIITEMILAKDKINLNINSLTIVQSM